MAQLLSEGQKDSEIPQESQCRWDLVFLLDSDSHPDLEYQPETGILSEPRSHPESE